MRQKNDEDHSMRSPLRSIFLVLLCVTFKVHGAEIYEFYNGVRALGMGGASVAVVNDETALLYNPAALGKLRDFFFTIADPEIEYGADTERVVGLTGVSKLLDPQDALNKAKLKPGKRSHVRGQVFPSFVVPNFGLGVFARTAVDAEVNEAQDAFEYNYRSDTAVVLGFNFRLFNGIVKLGTNLRVTNRTEILRDDLDPTATDLDFKTLAASGVGVGSDTGLLMTMPISWLPTIGAVYRDVGRTSFNLRDGMVTKTAEHPNSVPESVDVAIAIHPILGRNVRSSWTVEYSDVLTAGEEKDSMRRLHAGIEFNFADALFLRGGMNQRYWTAGVELSMFNYQFQAASYGEEIGTEATPREDRRYVGKFAIRF